MADLDVRAFHRWLVHLFSFDARRGDIQIDKVVHWILHASWRMRDCNDEVEWRLIFSMSMENLPDHCYRFNVVPKGTAYDKIERLPEVSSMGELSWSMKVSCFAYLAQRPFS